MNRTTKTGETRSYRDVFYTTTDGLRLHARDYAGPAGTESAGRLPVVCLPGLTRNAADFHRFAESLARDSARPRRVVAFDYRGRGESEWDRQRAAYTVVTETEDLLAGMAALGLAKAAFVGTSRGALIVHMLAAMRPGVIGAAVLNDAGPVIEGAGLAQIRGHLERMPTPANRQEAIDLLQKAHGRAFPALGENDWREMAEAIFRAGRNATLAADYDPAIRRQLKGVDFNTPLPTLWPQFDGLKAVSLMTIRGENSTLLSEATVTEMARRHPGMRVLTAPGQGHPPLLHVGGIDRAIADFLEASDPS